MTNRIERKEKQMSQTGKTSVLAVWSLVLGVLGFLGFWFVTGIPAIICGHIAGSRIKRSTDGLQGKGLALAGLITGYLSTAMFFVIVAALVVFGMMGDRIREKVELETRNMEAMEQPENLGDQ